MSGARRRVSNPYGPLPPLPPVISTVPKPKQIPNRSATSSFSRTITYKATKNLNIPIIYGPVRTGAAIIWEKQLSSGNWLSCYLIGWGPINSITNIKIDNEPLSTFGAVSDIYLGNTTTNASTNTRLTTNDAGWTSRLPGLAYVVIEFPNPKFVANGKEPDPHNFVCDIQGLLIPDYRLDSTLTTLYYTENVALCRADYWTNIRYGGGRPIDSIDWSTVVTAANLCDADIGGGKKRFKIGIQLGPDKSNWSENDRLLCLHCQGWDSYTSGKWQMFIDVDQTASDVVLTDTGSAANILSASVRVKEPEEVFNHFEFSYTDILNSYKSGTAITEDPGIALRTIPTTLPAKYDTRGNQDFDQAKRLSVWAFNRSRLDKEYTFEVLYDGGVKCVPGLVITVTSSDVDVSSQLMIVKSVEDIDDLSFTIICELFSHTTYSDIIQTTIVSAPPSGLSPFSAIPAPTGLSATPLVDETQIGIFTPKILVNFTPYSGVSGGGTLLTLQIGSGTIVSYGPFLSSPVQLIIPDGTNQSITIKAYSLDLNTGQAGSAFSTTTTTTYNPTTPNPVTAITDDLAGGVYWSKPSGQVKGYRLTGYDVNGAIWTKDITFTPTIANPIPISEWTKVTTTYYTEANLSFITRRDYLLQVQTISPTNAVSSSISYSGGSVVVPLTTPSPSVFGDASYVNGRFGVGGSSASPPAGTDFYVKNDKSGGTLALVENTVNDVNASSFFRASASSCLSSWISHAAARIVSRFGITLGGWTEFLITTGNGLLFGVTPASPIVFGTNNLERMRIDGAGAITINNTLAVTGAVTGNTVAIGGGNPIIKTITGSLASWGPGSILAGAQTSTTITVTGAVLGDLVVVSSNVDLLACVLTGYVSSAGVVTVVLRNGTASNKSFFSMDLKILIFRT